MSGTTGAYWPAGPTVALSVVATSHAAVPITTTDNSNAYWVAVVNSGAAAVAVKFGVAGDAATFAVDGTPGNAFVIPALTTVPIVLPLPQGVQNSPCNVTAIGAAAGPSIIYVTPLVMQK